LGLDWANKGVTVQKLAFLGGAVGVTTIALLSASGQAADRVGAAAPDANPMADITDVYAWMTGSNLNLVMDISPFDDGSHGFDSRVEYVFHVTSKAGLGLGIPGGTETRVILRFTSNTSIEGWVTDATGTVTKDFVSGDPSATTGVGSMDRKLRVFAGRRSDPAFGNPAGISDAATELGKNLASKDTAGCPTILDPEPRTIQNLLIKGTDAYATANVMAIVVQLDKSLVNVAPNRTVAVWASTHAGS
jgi:hypothetical protein